VIVCLVTDRRRAPVVEQARAAVEAGVDLVQVRERDLDTAHLSSLVAEVVRVTRTTATRTVVNDRLDVALACRADGVHLRADSVPAGRARLLAPDGFLIGRSVHSVDEAQDAAPDVDYLIAGTVFPTASKSGDRPLIGVEGLRAIASSVRIPVLAIGGVSLDRIGALIGAGAAGIAAIGLFASPASLSDIVRAARAESTGRNYKGAM
jgi:thiamine-phosphate pyrophosphorylase